MMYVLFMSFGKLFCLWVMGPESNAGYANYLTQQEQSP